MARKRFSDEDVLGLLRQIEVELSSGSDVPTACRSAGVSTVSSPIILDHFEVEFLALGAACRGLGVGGLCYIV